MSTVAFFIDGFNLYHSIDAYKKYHKYKWLNLKQLASILVKKSDLISNIYYFTALAAWDQKKVIKHRSLIRALEHEGIQVVYGRFKDRDKRCPNCKKSYRVPEEKQTDVNIAITLLTSAMLDEFDTSIILSGDSDLIPSIKAVKKYFPAKTIGIAIPIGRNANELIQISDFHIRIKEKHLAASIFPDEIDINGKKILKPSGWC